MVRPIVHFNAVSSIQLILLQSKSNQRIQVDAFNAVLFNQTLLRFYSTRTVCAIHEDMNRYLVTRLLPCLLRGPLLVARERVLL